MLGPQQAGFIDTVGIDMYIEMLNSAIMEKKGIKPEVKPEMTKANVKVDAYIPSSFATEDYEKSHCTSVWRIFIPKRSCLP